MTDNEFSAYLAGLIDGDGSVGAYNGQLRIRLVMTHSDAAHVIVDRLRGTEYEPYINECGSAQDKRTHRVFYIVWSSSIGVALAKRILPYSISKREQMQLATEWPLIGRGKRADIEQLVEQRRISAALKLAKASSLMRIEKDANYG